MQPCRRCSANIEDRFLKLTLREHIHCFSIHDAMDIALAQKAIVPFFWSENVRNLATEEDADDISLLDVRWCKTRVTPCSRDSCSATLLQCRLLLELPPTAFVTSNGQTIRCTCPFDTLDQQFDKSVKIGVVEIGKVLYAPNDPAVAVLTIPETQVAPTA